MILRFMLGVLMGAIVCSALVAVSQADEITERRRQLDALKDELDSKRARYDSLGQKEKSENIKLRDLEQQAALSSQLLLKIKKETQRLSADIDSQRLKLQITSLERDGREKVLARRMRYIYKVGNTPDWLEILGSGNPTLALAAFKNMRALLEYDRNLMKSYHDLTVNLESGLRKYQQDIRSVRKLHGEQEEELSKRENMLRSRRKLVERLRKNKTQVESSIKLLEDDAREIAGILEELETRSLQAEEDSTLLGLSNGRGNLIWPVRGRIIRHFGSVKDKKGIVLSNPGIDIQARLGADVLAAASGAVMYISWLRGYGQFIIVDHGKGYYTLYANLSDILVDVGDRVKGGELIALVGDSGSLEGPKLHFEVRHRREQLNPLEWLR